MLRLHGFFKSSPKFLQRSSSLRYVSISRQSVRQSPLLIAQHAQYEAPAMPNWIKTQVSSYSTPSNSPKSLRSPLVRGLPRSKVSIGRRPDLLVQQRRHFTPAQAVQLLMQIIRQLGPLLARAGPLGPVIYTGLTMLMTRVLPVVGLVMGAALLIYLWEISTTMAKLQSGVMVMGTVVACQLLMAFCTRLIDDAQTQTFRLVNEHFKGDIPFAATNTVYPEWQEKPFRLEPRSTRVTLQGMKVVMVTTWQAHVPINNQLFPGQESKAVIVAHTALNSTLSCEVEAVSCTLLDQPAQPPITIKSSEK